MGGIITFYSYKGGTGRSMALANLGHILAWQLAPRRKVLMIDWDLEAPGLHRFFFNQLKMNFSSLEREAYSDLLNKKPGLIDFLHDIARTYENEAGELSVPHAGTPAAERAFRNALSRHPLSEYILDVSPPDNISAADRPAGALSLMKAGNQDSNYTSLVRSFEWEKFYDQYGSFFVYFREYLASAYGAVLIDSRTGLTDIGDICTRVMPEKLVGVFIPNE